MKRCRLCDAPLDGPASKFYRLLFRRPAAPEDPAICGRCAKKKSSRTYVCQICQRVVNEADALTHVKTEEYLLELIRRDHPEWKEEVATCPRCIAYYRDLVRKANI